jgi:hypothetical protein
VYVFYLILCDSYNRITVEMNLCSFRSVRFVLLYIVTRSKIVQRTFIPVNLISYRILYRVTCIRFVCETYP